MRYLCVIMLWLPLIICCKDASKQKNTEKTQEGAFIAENSVLVLSPDFPESKDSIRLSDIADTVFYVSLKHGNTGVIQLYYLDSLVALNDGEYVYVFEPKGNVKSMIPLSTGSFDISPEKQRIYTYQNLKKEINSYDLNGNHIWRAKIKYLNSKDELGYYGYSFLSVNDTLFAISNINFGYNQDKLIFVNRQGHVVHNVANNERFTPPNSVYSTNRVWQRPLFRDYNKICYHSSYGDTLFAIDAEALTLPPVIIEEKLPKVPFEKRLEYTGEQIGVFHRYCTNNHSYDDNYICDNSIPWQEGDPSIWTDSCKYATRFFNTSRFLIVGYTHGSLMLPLSNFVIYDKKTKTLSRTRNDLNKGLGTNFLHFGIFNDYDGGLSFEPEHQSGDYLIMVNAGASQGGMMRRPKELYFEGRKITDTHCVCRSNTYQNLQNKERADAFFANEVNSETNTVLTIAKMKTK